MKIDLNLMKTVEIRTDQGGTDGIPHTFLYEINSMGSLYRNREIIL